MSSGRQLRGKIDRAYVGSTERPAVTGLLRFIILAAGLTPFGLLASSASGEQPAKPRPDSAFSIPPRAAVYAYQYHEGAYSLAPGAHLFVDWRYVYPGHTGYSFEGRGIQRDRPPDYTSEINDRIAVDPKSTPYGIRIELVKAAKLGPVIKNDKPWEFFTPYVTLIHHGDKYMLFYNTTTFLDDRGSKGYVTCYAESTDGVKYTKPELGVVEFDGSKANNIVLGPGVCKHGVHGPAVFVDPHAPPEERFKALYQAEPGEEIVDKLRAARPESVTGGGGVAVMAAVSPDGVRWRELEEPAMGHHNDTGTTAYWDQKLERYVGYFRMSAMGRRMIGRSETADFRRWPHPEMVLWPMPGDPAAVDYYTNGRSFYPGTQTMHLMFPMIYHRNLDTSTMRIASSIDGRVWNFLPGGAALQPGKVGEFDGGCIFPGAGLAEIPGDRVVMPYCGFAVPHKFPRLGPLGEVALAVWPKQRIAAIVADEDGYFVTNPLRAAGGELWLNFETSRGGSVRVEVDGVGGRGLGDCDPLFGNHLSKRVTWKGEQDIGVEPGGTFRLRFRLWGARLYSFEIR